jgi:predicted ester cyclase
MLSGGWRPDHVAGGVPARVANERGELVAVDRCASSAVGPPRASGVGEQEGGSVVELPWRSCKEVVDVSVDENKALYRRWFEEVVTNGDLALADELLGAGYVLHFPGMPTPVDSAGHKQLVVAFRSGFPDWAERIDDVIGEGDKVVIRVTGSGTHDGEFQGIAPTGRRVSATGIGIGRIGGGRIVEAWAAYDALGLMQQLGAVPR